MGFEESIDSKLAISSGRPDSIESKSPIPLSGTEGLLIDGTSAKKEKSSADSSISFASTSVALGI